MKRLISLGILVLAACGAPSPASWMPQKPLPEYADALRTWTRKAETYEAFESRVFVRATWFSPAFAAVYAARRAERLGMASAEAQNEAAAHIDAAQREVRLFVAVVTNEPFWNDLERGEAATLRARLMHQGNALAPVRIERISDDTLADMGPFFPYADPLTRAYWITFPMPAEGVAQGLHLRISGPPAIVDLHWEVL